MERVATDAAALSLDDAIGRLSLPREVVQAANGHEDLMLQDAGNTTQFLASNAKKEDSSAQGPFGAGTKLEKAMNFLNGEFKDIRKKMDVKLFECGFFKVEKVKELNLVVDDIARLAEKITLLEGKISNYQAEIIAEQRNLDKLEMELGEYLENCQETREALLEEERLIKDDRDVAQLIIDVARKECGLTKLLGIKACVSADGTTEFTTENDDLQSAITKLKTPAAQAAMQRVLYESSGLEDEELPGSAPPPQMAPFGGKQAKAVAPHHQKRRTNNVMALQRSVAAPVAETAKGPPASAADNFCPVGVKPNCDPLLDKLGSMLGDILESLAKKQKQLHDHNKVCEAREKDYKKDIAECQETIGVANVQLMQATAEKQSKIATQTQRFLERHKICTEMREKFEQCHKEIRGLEEELCAIFKVRQSTYQQLKNGESPDIQDCMVGPWISGECSKSCWGELKGIAGKQLMTREIVAQNNTFGATCPPLALTRACGKVECPIDCVLDVWAGWSGCTKDCGGGSKSRTRAVLTADEHGGIPCDTTEQAVACNTFSCDQDCTLQDWNAWTPCTKACRGEPTSDAGRQYRKRHIKTKVKGAGTCPLPKDRARYDHRVCNPQLCPEKMECIAAMDLVVLMDGSGSLWRPTKPRDNNFEFERNYVVDLIKHSVMDGHVLKDQDEMPPTNVRMGVLQFGGVMYNRRKFRKQWKWGRRKGKWYWRGGWEGKPAKVVSKITGDKKGLITAVKAEKWMRGFTPTDKAVDQAMSMLQYSKPDRIQAMAIITDGKPTDPPKANEAIRLARLKGIRVIIVAAGEEGKMAVNEDTICSLASPPCADNSELAYDWSDLTRDFNRFFINSCPAVNATATE
jgi:hypothetical protein